MKIVIAVCAVLSLSGCVSLKNSPLTDEAKQTLPGKSVVQVVQAKPSFAVMTASHAMFSVIGAAAALADGNKMVKEKQINDPALAISNKLTDKLQSGYSVVRQEQDIPVIDVSDIGQLAAKFPSNDYVLDVQTVGWTAVYFPTNWTHYRVMYTAKARLIDTKQAKVVAESGCQRVPDRTDDSPTYDELLADDAARLKQTLAEHAESCSEEMSKQMFNL